MKWVIVKTHRFDAYDSMTFGMFDDEESAAEVMVDYAKRDHEGEDYSIDEWQGATLIDTNDYTYVVTRYQDKEVLKP